MNLHLRPSRANLLFEPGAGWRVAMAKKNGVRVYVADEIKQFFTIGVGAQIKIIHFAILRHLAGTGAENKSFAVPGGLESTRWALWIRIPDKENGVPLFTKHADGQFMRGRLLRHH